MDPQYIKPWFQDKKESSFTCWSNNVANLALTVCPNLEQLQFDVVLLVGMQRCFHEISAMIGYLRDACTQYWREDVWGGEFIRSEWKLFTARAILSCPSLRHWLASTTRIDAPAPHKVTLHRGMDWS